MIVSNVKLLGLVLNFALLDYNFIVKESYTQAPHYFQLFHFI